MWFGIIGLLLIVTFIGFAFFQGDKVKPSGDQHDGGNNPYPGP